MQKYFGQKILCPKHSSVLKIFVNKIIDQKIRKTFLGEVRSACDGELSHWVNTARGALALIIILDQFTRNVFRNTPQAYSGDELALNILNTSIKCGYDIVLSPASTIWLYHPFHHSEKVEEQDHGLEAVPTDTHFS